MKFVLMPVYGETLRVYRTMKKLTQHGVASQLDISQQDYSKWENKEIVTEEFLERFLKAMQCSLEELQQIQKLHYQQ
ncbi:MAG: helix-turn-helix transcriptional regulator [Agriterribacter sp.]